MFTPVTHPSRKTVLIRKRINKLIRDLVGQPEKDRANWIERIKADPYRTFPWEIPAKS
jgi:hypothetical protein